jgi:hypothetical protein
MTLVIAFRNFDKVPKKSGYAVTQLIKALRHKPEGRGFDSR